MLGWFLLGLLIVVGLGALLYQPARRFLRAINAERGHELFQLQREMLEAKFVELARSTGNPRGARWADCDFEGDPRFARNVRSGELVAFMEVTVHFETPDEHIDSSSEIIGNNRQATAVFHFHHGQWGTSGRTLFDMSPEEAIEHYSNQYEPLAFAEHGAH